MNLCQKCINSILESFEKFPYADPEHYAEKYFTPYGEAVSESECEFWSHFILNKTLKHLGWKLLTNEEKNKLFERMEKEDPEFAKKLNEMMSK